MIARAVRACVPALVLVLAACDPNVVVGSAPAAQSDEEDAGSAPLPKVSWLSGAHAGNDLQNYLDYGTWRKRPLDVAALYVDRSTWGNVVAPSWPVDMFSSFTGKLLLNLPLYPEGGMGNNQDCAAGMYDAQWKMFGSFLVAHKRPDAIIRLGWGWNDGKHAWRADADPADWIACFQHVVKAIRSSDAQVQIDWSFNPVGAPEVADRDPYEAYPGDDYVDFVGLEAFDMYPPTRDAASWDQKCKSTSGLCYLADFVRAHHKKIGIAEWGVVTCGGDPGGDNPFFVTQMFETFAQYTDLMGYEAYFEDVDSEVCSALHGTTNKPHAVARYLELYGPR